MTDAVAAMAAERLSDAARARLRAAETEAGALLALAELRAALDPHGVRTRWSVAGELERRLDAYAAHRQPPPRSTLERNLAAVCGCTSIGRTRRRLFALLG